MRESEYWREYFLKDESLMQAIQDNIIPGDSIIWLTEDLKRSAN